MKLPIKRQRTLPIILIGLFAVGLIVTSAITLQNSRFNALPHLISEVTPTQKAPFPDTSGLQLSQTQQRIVTLLKQEYDAQNKGTKYSGGVDEPWCADFVSWIMHEAGVPLRNPNSGSWRIPGTYTLREYYQTAGTFRPGDSGYQPKVGDVMLYDNPSPFGQHTNIVVQNKDGVVTTVGGNEPGGIRVYTHTTPDKAGFVGYGVL